MALNINRGEGGLITGFVNHFAFGVKQNIGEHQKNFLEKIGDVGLWMLEKFPGKVWKVMKDPRVVTIALTALALLAASFAFYPVTTFLIIKAALALLPVIPFWTIHLSAYIATVGLIISTACRAEGRFMNSELMKEFYSKPAAEAVV